MVAVYLNNLNKFPNRGTLKADTFVTNRSWFAHSLCETYIWTSTERFPFWGHKLSRDDDFSVLGSFEVSPWSGSSNHERYTKRLVRLGGRILSFASHVSMVAIALFTTRSHYAPYQTPEMRTEWMTNGSHKEGSNSFSLLSLFCCLSMMRLTICFGHGQLYFRQHFTGFQPTGYGCMCVAVWFVILYVWVCGIPVIGNILPQSIPWQNGNHWWAGRIWIPPESIPQHRLVLSRALLVPFILFVFHHLQPLLDGGTC